MSWLADNALGIFGGLLGAKGQRDANKTNIALSREQMAFQERMSNSAYQRAMADMRKAGLNPILAAKQPASTPGGQTTRVESALGAGVNAFNTTSSAMAQKANLNANTTATTARGELDQAKIDHIKDPNASPETKQARLDLYTFGVTGGLLSGAVNLATKEKSDNEIMEYLKIGLMGLGIYMAPAVLRSLPAMVRAAAKTSKKLPKVTKPGITAAQKKTVETFERNGIKYYFDDKGVLHKYKGK